MGITLTTMKKIEKDLEMISKMGCMFCEIAYRATYLKEKHINKLSKKAINQLNKIHDKCIKDKDELGYIYKIIEKL